LFALSFRLYSAYYYPVLNSDNAVTVLMIHYFDLPNDLYFWGQDRMGSLIPLLAQIPNKLLNASPLIAESLIHYLILLAGFISFAYFIKSYFLKFVFAVIWFFPPFRLIDVTQFAFGIHYSLIAISCLLYEILLKKKIRDDKFLNHLILILIVLTLIASIWVSDMAIVSVSLFLIIHLYILFQKKELRLSLFTRLEFFYFIFGLIFCILFIQFAKSSSSSRLNYVNFSSFQEIIINLKIFFGSVLKIFLFQANEPFTSVYSYLSILLFYSLYRIIKLHNLKLEKNWIFIFFVVDALILFCLILSSKWTFLNGVPRRYFTCSYISISFSTILLLDLVLLNNKLKALILFTVLIGGAGTIFNIKFVWPKTLRPRADISREFEKLGEIGIISEYWNSYIISCVNPSTLKATPHDSTWAVRNYNIVDEVFKQENIYLIKDMWLANFPDTVREFGRTLVKEGDSTYVGECNICKYNLIR
jgi:hypothetical protein